MTCQFAAGNKYLRLLASPTREFDGGGFEILMSAEANVDFGPFSGVGNHQPREIAKLCFDARARVAAPFSCVS